MNRILQHISTLLLASALLLPLLGAQAQADPAIEGTREIPARPLPGYVPNT